MEIETERLADGQVRCRFPGGETVDVPVGGRATEQDFFGNLHLDCYTLAANYLDTMVLDEGHILDVGCGSGYGLAHLKSRHPEVACIGMEPDERARRFARLRLGDAATVLPHTALERWPLPDTSIRMVVMVECIEHLVNPAFALDEAHRVLHRSGWLFVTTPEADLNKADLEAQDDHPDNHWHEREYTQWGFVRELSDAGFRVMAFHRSKRFPRQMIAVCDRRA